MKIPYFTNKKLNREQMSDYNRRLTELEQHRTDATVNNLYKIIKNQTKALVGLTALTLGLSAGLIFHECSYHPDPPFKMEISKEELEVNIIQKYDGSKYMEAKSMKRARIK